MLSPFWAQTPSASLQKAAGVALAGLEGTARALPLKAGTGSRRRPELAAAEISATSAPDKPEAPRPDPTARP